MNLSTCQVKCYVVVSNIQIKSIELKNFRQLKLAKPLKWYNFLFFNVHVLWRGPAKNDSFSFLFDGLSIFRHEIVSAQGQLYNRAEGVTYFIVFNSQCLRPPQQRSKGVEPIGLTIF